MRRAIPPIVERADDLKQRLQHDYARRQQPRVPMLYFLASGHAETRQQVAPVLGLSRTTVGRWLAHDESGGLAALLPSSGPAGKRPARMPDGLAWIEHAGRHPEGLASYEALCQWGERSQHVQVTSTTRYTMVRTWFKAQRNVARPRHTKKP